MTMHHKKSLRRLTSPDNLNGILEDRNITEITLVSWWIAFTFVIFLLA